jgi:ankyrin repeat protein
MSLRFELRQKHAKSDNLGLDRFVAQQMSKREARQELRRLASEEQAAEHRAAAREKELVNMLFDACKNKPSSNEVSLIVNMCPETVKGVNEFGQTPVHVAAANGASANVIVYLLHKFPKACAMTDSSGKVPLHYVAHFSLWTVEGPSRREATSYDAPVGERGQFKKFYVGPTYLDMVKLTCQANPSAILIEDMQGRNPIEYALLQDASMEVIKTLQHRSIKCLRAIQAGNKMKNVSAPLSGDFSCSQNPVPRPPLQQQGNNLVAGRSA